MLNSLYIKELEVFAIKKAKKIISFVLIFMVLASSAYINATAASSDSTAGKITTVSGNLNVRASASVYSQVVTKLSSSTYVTLISKNADWWYIEYSKGKYGYCSSEYISPLSDTYAAFALGSLNIRSGPGTAYGIIGWLNSSDYAVILSSSGTWKKILYDGVSIGYVNGSYLKSDLTYAPLSLNVPSYKQTDSRWANIPLGSYGETIGSIGCSTVSLAMSESYRTGRTIYPSEIKNSLNYTAGGAVYWPSNYTAYTESNYLEAIYNQLKVGKPVLVGSKDSSGGQHWVVVTGFTGGSSLISARFTINDPGSSSRTNLQQYFDFYPNFYKIMFY